MNAHALVTRAIKEGRLVRPQRCEKCGKRRKTVAHHEDYSKPLEVKWLCYSCHRSWHAENGDGLNREMMPRFETASLRLDEDSNRLLNALVDHLEKKTMINMNVSRVLRIAIYRLAQQEGLK